ncbi:hypothetical protein M0R01_04910 [bacterium]|jgi:effector-binding domain-containing protein|nr:hypothetical protein [bacterium]
MNTQKSNVKALFGQSVEKTTKQPKKVEAFTRALAALQITETDLPKIDLVPIAVDVRNTLTNEVYATITPTVKDAHSPFKNGQVGYYFSSAIVIDGEKYTFKCPCMSAKADAGLKVLATEIAKYYNDAD